jgi:fructosamine-3-kinase
VSVDGVLKAVVEQKTPVARVFANEGSFYIDYEGNKMPLSANYTARVPLVSGEINATYWEDFGHQLALMHLNSSDMGHGLGYTNYLGAAEQKNDWNLNGVRFFIENRLKHQIEIAVYHRKIDLDIENKFNSLFEKLPELIPNETSSLLHGDLWSGNAMVNAVGQVVLVDPSCYYGLREAELAFTTMFGGFDKTFYEAYHEAYPIEKGFHERIPIYNLYPLMVHVNLFGEGYVPAVQKILNSY